MNHKSKEIILKDIIRRLQTAVKTTLEKGKISSDAKKWIEKTVEAVNQDLTRMDSLTREKTSTHS
ncbi:MAG: hypothetical protein FWC43_14385 [Planctomycetaceae bacterium]|nr:hypothetical protein [Planctomycetaceae bacterium]